MHRIIKGFSTFCLLALAACASGGPRVETAGVPEVAKENTYTFIKFGGNYGKDVRAVAFLDIEGDATVLEPYAPEFDFTKKPGMSAGDALLSAEQFLKGQTGYRSTALRKIVVEGRVVGYEVRPLYLPYEYGVQDVLMIGYRMKDNRVLISVQLLPEVEKIIEGHERQQ